MRFKVRDMAILARLPSPTDTSTEGLLFHTMRLETIAPYVACRSRMEIIEVDPVKELYKAQAEFGPIFFVSDEMLDPVTP